MLPVGGDGGLWVDGEMVVTPPVTMDEEVGWGGLVAAACVVNSPMAVVTWGRQWKVGKSGLERVWYGKRGTRERERWWQDGS